MTPHYAPADRPREGNSISNTTLRDAAYLRGYDEGYRGLRSTVSSWKHSANREMHEMGYADGKYDALAPGDPTLWVSPHGTGLRRVPCTLSTS